MTTGSNTGSIHLINFMIAGFGNNTSSKIEKRFQQLIPDK